MKTRLNIQYFSISNVANSTALPPLLEWLKSTKNCLGMQVKAAKVWKYVEFVGKTWDDHRNDVSVVKVVLVLFKVGCILFTICYFLM